MTLDEFLREPVAAFLNGKLEGVPDELVRQAWDADEDDPERSLRKFVTGDIWHEANNGCLPLVAGQLRWLGHVLREDQWAGLYRDVRDDEPHRESEIREEFVRAAPAKQAHLPPPLTRQEVIELLGSEELARELGVFDDAAGEQR
jgi:hypothetical protein